MGSAGHLSGLRVYRQYLRGVLIFHVSLLEYHLSRQFLCKLPFRISSNCLLFRGWGLGGVRAPRPFSLEILAFCACFLTTGCGRLYVATGVLTLRPLCGMS